MTHGAFPATLAGGLAWSSGALLIANVSRFQRMQGAAMATLGVAALMYAIAHGDDAWTTQLFEGNQALLAMLVAVSFLRMVTRSGAAVAEQLPRGRRAIYQTLAATHLFSAVVNISALFIVGHHISRDGSLTALQAKAISRAFVAAACWSPMFASMAVVLHYVPGTDVFTVSRINIVFAMLLLAWSAFDLGRAREAGEFTGYPLHREALTAPLLLSVVVIALYHLPYGWPILTTLAVAALGCVGVLSVRRGWHDIRRRFIHHVSDELPRMGGEFTLFLGATILASGIAAAARVSELALVIDPAQAESAIGMLLVLVALILVRIHPVISVASLSGLFPATLTQPDLVALVVLMAWSIGLAASPFSNTTLSLQSRFGIPATRFLVWNLPFLLSGLLFASAVLLVVDYSGLLAAGAATMSNATRAASP